MAYEYTELSAEERAEIAKGQVRQFEAELFGHEMNKARAEALPKNTPGREEQIKTADDSQAVILSALETTKAAQVDLETAAVSEVAGT